MAQILRHGLFYQLPSSPQRPFPERRIEVAFHGERRPAFASPLAALPSRTQMIMERISTVGEVGGAGGAYSYAALKRLDKLWSNLCAIVPDEPEICEVVSQISGPSLFQQCR
ncbi:hypothetical protein HPP92_017701 [Vanilla planifolia]|uniref:Uncharacterized protein n=1 Tax=Vanilla planifolia TaxID=51239 RepID=A0A835QBK7_VANPL|nr:hypothetical protein HPP92_017701 [Vanilla planifolia]